MFSAILVLNTKITEKFLSSEEVNSLSNFASQSKPHYSLAVANLRIKVCDAFLQAVLYFN